MTRRLPDISHVDLIGAAVLLLMFLAGWWLVLAPWQATWREYRQLSALRSKAETELRRDMIELSRFTEDLAWLENVIAGESREVPRAGALPELLQAMTQVAEQAEVELLTVAPQPGEMEGDYWVTDIRLVGRAESRAFIRFLDQLAEQNPYQALRACSIRRPADDEEPVCNVAWTVRFYMLPDVDQGGSS